MQRFLPIQGARLTVVGSMMHDPKEANKAAQIIAARRPRRVIIDRSVDEWAGMQSDAYQQMVVRAIPRLRPEALWRVTAEVAQHVGAEVVLLHRHVPDVPAKALQDLDRLLRREGFDARGDPKLDLMKLHSEFVARVPVLWQYIEGRRDASAARLRAALETRPDDAMVVLPWPDGDAICDRVQHWSSPRRR